MRNISKDEARRIGAKLKLWSQRPASVGNARALGLCGVLIVLVVVAAQHAPKPALAVRGMSVMFAVMLAATHFVSLTTLRGLLRAGIVEARDALDAMRNPRRISAFDMAMVWLLVAGLARWVGDG